MTMPASDLALSTWIRRANDALGYDVYPVDPAPPPTARELDEQRRSDEEDRALGFDPDEPYLPEYGPLTLEESARRLRWELSLDLGKEADKLLLTLEDPEENARDRYNTFREFEQHLGKALIYMCVPLNDELTIQVDGTDVTFRNCSRWGSFVVRMVGESVQMRNATPREFAALLEHRSNEYRRAVQAGPAST